MKREYTFRELHDELRRVEQQTIHHFKAELNVISHQVYTTTFIFDEINNRHQRTPSLEKAWKEHVAKVITSFQGAISCVSRGLFSECANLVRVGLETAWQIVYMERNPNESVVQKWFQGDKIPVSTVRKSLNYSNERWEIYEAFCQVSHPRKEGLELYYSYVKGYVRFGPTFEPAYSEELLYYIHMFLGWIHEDFIYCFFPDVFGNEKRPTESYSPMVQSYLQDRERSEKLFKSRCVSPDNVRDI